MAAANPEPQDKKNKREGLSPSTIRIGKRYRANRLQGPYDAVVIGSGIGGLTAAALLSQAGSGAGANTSSAKIRPAAWLSSIGWLVGAAGSSDCRRWMASSTANKGLFIRVCRTKVQRVAALSLGAGQSCRAAYGYLAVITKCLPKQFCRHWWSRAGHRLKCRC